MVIFTMDNQGRHFDFAQQGLGGVRVVVVEVDAPAEQPELDAVAVSGERLFKRPQRFGVSSPKRQSLIRMVNAFEKAETVAHVLKTLGCPEAAVYTTSTIPVSCYVRFVPTKELEALLQIEEVLTEAEFKEAHPNSSPGAARIPL